jgi:gamma-glutamylcyclotransferase (GGCT)/AIG2-like uncharacterized protein YtfP
MSRRLLSTNRHTQRLFVYGSLGPGRPNEHILTSIFDGVRGRWEQDCAATLRGLFLRAEGWGAAMGFPGIIPDEKGEEVSGFLYAIDTTNQLEEDLHAFWINLMSLKEMPIREKSCP